MAYRKSRLQRNEEKKAVRSTLFYIVLTVGIIALMFVAGIPALSKVTALVAGITGTEAIDFGPDGPPPPPPNIDNPPAYTKEDSIRLTGTTRPGYTATIFFNDDKIEVLANADGRFTSVLEISSGQNTVSAIVTDNKGRESTRTHTYTIVQDKEPPVLEIISPENGKSFYGARDKQIKLEGQTDPGARVLINDRVVIVRSDGKFDMQVTLENGENVFKMKSIDQAGNETELEWKLNFAS